MDTNSFKANAKIQTFKLQIPRWLNQFITKMQLSEPPWILEAVRTQQLSPVLVSMGYLKSGELSDSAGGTWICFSRAGAHLPAASGSRQVQRAGHSQASTPRAHSFHKDSRGSGRWPWSTIKCTETPEDPAAGATLVSPPSRAIQQMFGHLQPQQFKHQNNSQLSESLQSREYSVPGEGGIAPLQFFLI